MIPINEQEKAMTERLMNSNIAGQWPIMYFGDASTPGYLVSRSIKIKTFSNGKASFQCRDLWFYEPDGSATRIWSSEDTEEEMSWSIFDFYQKVEAHMIQSLAVNKMIGAIIDGRIVCTNYRSFMTGMMTSPSGLKAIDDHFGIKPKDVLVSIRNSVHGEKRDRIPAKLNSIQLEKQSVN